MKKITIYVHDQVDGAAVTILEEGDKSLATWLWDNNLEVVDIKCDEVTDEEENKVLEVKSY